MIKRIPSGITEMDLELGGGWPMGRPIQVFGKSSTNKTGLAINIVTNFLKEYPKGQVRYLDIEAAFDTDYASEIGFPVDDPRVEFLGTTTVEEFERDLSVFVEECTKEGVPGLFIVDSLDAMTTKEDQETFVEDASGYGMKKAKDLRRVYKHLVNDMALGEVTLFVISHITTKPAARPGMSTEAVGGGTGPEFYSTVRVKLTKIKDLSKTRLGIDQAYGVKVQFFIAKNKGGNPFGKGEFDIHFGRGVDDVGACLDWIINKADKMDLLPIELITNEVTSGRGDKKKTEMVKIAKKGAVDEVKIKLAAVEDKEKRKEYIRAIRDALRDHKKHVNDLIKEDTPLFIEED